jgi:hypothetical protein
MYKQILSISAIALTLYAFLPYIRSILRGKTKPHVFSWVIWGVTTFTVFFAQLAGGAGFGAWSIGLSGLITLYIACLAYIQRTDITITQSDWIFFIVALSALPIWFLMADPVWAVVILTTVDLMGFVPTIRKAYTYPDDENLLFFGLFGVRNLLVILALEQYSITTVLFPAAVGVTCFVFILFVAYRRST